MKINEKQLRQIIRESLKEMAGMCDKPVFGKRFGDAKYAGVKKAKQLAKEQPKPEAQQVSPEVKSLAKGLKEKFGFTTKPKYSQAMGRDILMFEEPSQVNNINLRFGANDIARQFGFECAGANNANGKIRLEFKKR